MSEIAGGRPVVVVFYVYDFSPICTTQMCEVRDMELLTINDDAAVVGVSANGPYSHQRFAEEHDISYPLLSDPMMRVYEQYGMVTTDDDEEPIPARGFFLLDADRTVRHVWRAEETWADWQVRRLREMNDEINELVG